MKPMPMPLLAALLLAPLARSQQPDAKSAPEDRKARIAAVQQEFQDAEKAAYAKYRAATTDEERRRVIENEMPDDDVFVGKLWPIVDEAPADPAVADALAWIVQHSGDAAGKGKALGALLAHHLQAESLGGVCTSLVYQPSKNNLDFAKAVVAKTPHKPVRGKALWAQAQLLSNGLDSAASLKSDRLTAEQLANFKKRLGADTVAWLESLDATTVGAEAEKLYEQIAADYADVELWSERSLADAAKGELFERRNLAIGKVAPDIVGKDADGVEFKLSDYRGKVVLLDFWGFW